jgi:hypothetical protein
MQKARGWFNGSPLSTTVASQKTPPLSTTQCSEAVEQCWTGSSFCSFALPVLSDIVPCDQTLVSTLNAMRIWSVFKTKRGDAAHQKGNPKKNPPDKKSIPFGPLSFCPRGFWRLLPRGVKKKNPYLCQTNAISHQKRPTDPDFSDEPCSRGEGGGLARGPVFLQGLATYPHLLEILQVFACRIAFIARLDCQSILASLLHLAWYSTSPGTPLRPVPHWAVLPWFARGRQKKIDGPPRAFAKSQTHPPTIRTFFSWLFF